MPLVITTTHDYMRATDAVLQLVSCCQTTAVERRREELRCLLFFPVASVPGVVVFLQGRPMLKLVSAANAGSVAIMSRVAPPTLASGAYSALRPSYSRGVSCCDCISQPPC